MIEHVGDDLLRRLERVFAQHAAHWCLLALSWFASCFVTHVGSLVFALQSLQVIGMAILVFVALGRLGPVSIPIVCYAIFCGAYYATLVTVAGGSPTAMHESAFALMSAALSQIAARLRQPSYVDRASTGFLVLLAFLPFAPHVSHLKVMVATSLVGAVIAFYVMVTFAKSKRVSRAALVCWLGYCLGLLARPVVLQDGVSNHLEPTTFQELLCGYYGLALLKYGALFELARLNTGNAQSQEVVQARGLTAS